MTLRDEGDSAILGIEVDRLPAGYTPIDAVAAVKCLDEEGRPVVVTRGTGLMVWEAIGMLTVALDYERAAARQENES